MERSTNNSTATGFVDSSLFGFVNTMEPFTQTNHLTFGSLQSSHATCQLNRSPQPSYPWSSYPKTEEGGLGNLEGVGSIDEIDWEAVMGFNTSMQNTLPHGSIFSDSSSSWDSGLMENEVINPKKKQRGLEQGDGFCKRCKCKKSKCLMLYCGCFAAGVYCMGPCACINCFNMPTHKDKVLAARKQIELRNLVALDPKVMRWSDSLSAPRWHKRGCNCKKGCQMKYCGCHEGSVGCSIYCRCEGCKNSFGTKESGELNRSSFQKTTITNTVASRTCHLNKLALEVGDSINAWKSGSVPSAAPTTSTVLAGDELDQSFGGGLVSNVAGPGSSTTTYDNNLHGSSSLFANSSSIPAFSQCFGQQMASSGFGFASQPNPPSMFPGGHQASGFGFASQPNPPSMFPGGHQAAAAPQFLFTQIPF